MGACDDATALEWTWSSPGVIIEHIMDIFPFTLYLILYFLYFLSIYVVTSSTYIYVKHLIGINNADFQVVGAVAFQNRRLAIPQNTSPVLASLMESCWAE